MNDILKVLVGLVVLVAIFLAPIVYARSTDEPDPSLKPVLQTSGTPCVDSAAAMASSHMKLLETWRDDVVRGGDRTFTTADGRQVDKSLTGTCLGCHTNKSQFCDACHSSAGVAPSCWTCHNVPGAAE